jgi:hypothetical protein
MNFRERLDKEHSKTTTNTIVNEICNQPKKMDELMQIFIDGPLRITQRAAWPLGFVAQQQPSLLLNYYDLLIDHLYKKDNHQAITRNILRALQFTNIPKKYQGKILTKCFDFLNDSNEPIATKVFSMTVAYNLSKEYPDIVPELKASIENLLPNGSAGIKSRGKKILKEINKL